MTVSPGRRQADHFFQERVPSGVMVSLPREWIFLYLLDSTAAIDHIIPILIQYQQLFGDLSGSIRWAFIDF